ncbi:MAG: hypothetical protein Q8L21_00830 [Candidatus Komeilibacteria bacterium]|nr:hypothetical protein [Candidatus Komeilibacteria bacterium]
MLKKVLFLSLASLILAGCSLLPANTEDISPTGASIPLTIKDGQGSRITLTSPLADQVLTSPFLVAGNTDINTDKVYVRVKNPSGEGVIDAWTAIKSSLDDIGS